MGIKPVKAETAHRADNVIMELQFVAINWRRGRKVAMVYERLTEIRIGFKRLNIMRKIEALCSPDRILISRDRSG
jgi:hypothetical protein